MLTTRTRPPRAAGDHQRRQSLSQPSPGVPRPITLSSPLRVACLLQDDAVAREHPSAERSILRPTSSSRFTTAPPRRHTRALPSHSIILSLRADHPSGPRFPLERARHRQTVSRAPLRCVSKRHLSWLSAAGALNAETPLLTPPLPSPLSLFTSSRCCLLLFVPSVRHPSRLSSPSRLSASVAGPHPPTTRHSFSRDRLDAPRLDLRRRLCTSSSSSSSTTSSPLSTAELSRFAVFPPPPRRYPAFLDLDPSLSRDDEGADSRLAPCRQGYSVPSETVARHRRPARAVAAVKTDVPHFGRDAAARAAFGRAEAAPPAPRA